jgi:formamidopyrimidine-DNA glycosylase
MRATTRGTVPELPEVETVVRTLRPRLVGARVRAIWWSGQPLHLLRPPDLAAIERVCAGGRVAGVRRRGKFILVDMVAGRGGGVRGSLLVHLGMTGRLRVAPAGEVRAAHTHLVWQMDGARELRFVDPRRFGWVAAAAAEHELRELAGLGPDPLAELTVPMLAEALASSRAPIKAFLLDQRRIAGLGNIYVSEALFRAGVHPTTVARRARGRAAALVAGIRAALELGIANRGTTLRDYVDADGAAGDNAAALLVYGREGEGCPTCKTPVKRRVDAGRSTFFCGRCQRR